MGRIMEAINVLLGKGNQLPAPSEYFSQYALKWEWYAGTWRSNAGMSYQQKYAPAIYTNTRRLWSESKRTISFYSQFVYQGDLSTDGNPLPDGTRGAIPIDPQIDNGGSADQALTTAFHECFNMWYWKQHMSYRPRIAAILGDCLTEIIDIPEKGIVVPVTVWPGWVTDLELDQLGNIKAYAIEYQVVEPSQPAKFGRSATEGQNYRYRKEVTDKEVWTYKDGKLFAYGDKGAAWENPFGFAPAIWDRFQIQPDTVRGISALEQTMSQAMEINSILSHASDYQRKQFSAPIGVKGSSIVGRGGRTIQLLGGVTVNFPDGYDPSPDDVARARNEAAERFPLLQMNEHGEFVSIQFDIGKTKELLDISTDSVLAELPEANYGDKLMNMSEATGPGMERILKPVLGPLKSARQMIDPQTVKLLQMSTTMMGHMVNENLIPSERLKARKKRFDVFKPYTLESFGQGMLDASIPDRPVFETTQMERAQLAVLLGSITDPYLMTFAGIPEEEVKKIVSAREERMKQEDDMAMLAITGAGEPDTQDTAKKSDGPSAN